MKNVNFRSQVDVFLSRDLDSIFSDRETAAVEEWMKSSSSVFHTMRDHPTQSMPFVGNAVKKRRLWFYIDGLNFSIKGHRGARS